MPTLLTTLTPNRKRLLLVFGVICLVLLGYRIILILTSLAFPVGYDARSYIAAAHAVRLGFSPYATDTWQHIFIPVTTSVYLYPPFLAFLLIPLTFLPFITATYVCVILAIATATILVAVLQRSVGWWLALLSVLAFPPTWHTIYLGQINLLIAVFLAIAFYNLQIGKERLLGISLALGTIFKVTPVLGLYVLARNRRFSGILAYTITIVLAIVPTLLLVRPQVWLAGGIAAIQQQWVSPEFVSWTGIFAHWLGPRGDFLGIALSMILLALTLVRVRSLPLPLSLAAVTFLPLLIARITWEHHAVIALPALALLWNSTTDKKLTAGAAWGLITLVGGIAMPIGITICWITCCWPNSIATAFSVGRRDSAANS